jgi:cytochrome c-type biogenesis protein CcmH/NrfF
MDTTVILWLWPVVVLAYLVGFWAYLRRQDRPNASERHSPAE